MTCSSQSVEAKAAAWCLQEFQFHSFREKRNSAHSEKIFSNWLELYIKQELKENGTCKITFSNNEPCDVLKKAALKANYSFVELARDFVINIENDRAQARIV
ncbi:MAG TPA: hypothetical protein DCL21_05135 [Alphaproteobacteria bacterium]|nr:hypothetical protein [Alphaproteobacteria bacterium]